MQSILMRVTPLIYGLDILNICLLIVAILDFFIWWEVKIFGKRIKTNLKYFAYIQSPTWCASRDRGRLIDWKIFHKRHVNGRSDVRDERLVRWIFTRISIKCGICISFLSDGGTGNSINDFNLLCMRLPEPEQTRLVKENFLRIFLLLGLKIKIY
jgi:hypothetical protein